MEFMSIVFNVFLHGLPINVWTVGNVVSVEHAGHMINLGFLIGLFDLGFHCKNKFSGLSAILQLLLKLPGIFL